MTDRSAEVAKWLDAFTGSGHSALRDAAERLIHVIEALPASGYRDMAMCKMADLLPLAFVAARQSPQTQGDPL